MAMVDAGKNMVGIIPDDVNGGNWIALSGGARMCRTACPDESSLRVFANKSGVCGARARLRFVAIHKSNAMYRNFAACQIKGRVCYIHKP
jgi:hypothetical protein